MLCPQCKNKGFEATADVLRPLRYQRKESYDKMNYRYVFCMQCGYSFVTVEVFERSVEIKRNQVELFDNGGK